MESRISVIDYLDYREYLRAYVAAKRSSSPRWSYGVWARKLGVKSTSLLTMVLKGKRDVSPQLAERFTTFFSMSAVEAAYFHDLVEIQRARRWDHDVLRSFSAVARQWRLAPMIAGKERRRETP